MYLQFFLACNIQRAESERKESHSKKLNIISTNKFGRIDKLSDFDLDLNV